MSRIDISLDQDGAGTEYSRELRSDKNTFTHIRLLTRKLPDGKAAVLLVAGDCHILLTARNFLEAAAAVKGAHPSADDRSMPATPAGAEIGGMYRAQKWSAVHMEHVYLVSAECRPNDLNFAGDERTAHMMARAVIDRHFDGDPNYGIAPAQSK